MIQPLHIYTSKSFQLLRRYIRNQNYDIAINNAFSFHGTTLDFATFMLYTAKTVNHAWLVNYETEAQTAIDSILTSFDRVSNTIRSEAQNIGLDSIDPGLYYLQLRTTDSSYFYSEVFKICDDIEGQWILEFWHDRNFGNYVFDSLFKFYQRLNATFDTNFDNKITKEVIEDGQGGEWPSFNRIDQIYRFKVIGDQNLSAVLNLSAAMDNIYLTDETSSRYRIQIESIAPTVLQNTNMAEFDVKFTKFDNEIIPTL